VLAFAQGLSAHRAGRPLFPTVCRQDERSSMKLQIIPLLVITPLTFLGGSF
jgi:hypothetical protein